MTQLLTAGLLWLSCISQAWGKERVYYIGITEIVWDYCPSEMDVITGKPIAEEEHASVFLQQGPDRIGRLYKKAVYTQYTNGSFTEEVKKPAWLGYMGPVIRAQVGDSLVIHLKNFASRNYSMHSHGVKYNKSNEGALYPDNTTGINKEDDMVAPGEGYTYTWDVVEEHGPGKGDQDCVTRIYHSHINAPKDISSGLIGPLIICKHGVLCKQAEPLPETEFILMFSVVDENLSWYLDDNIGTYCTADVDKEDEDFQESNNMHAINGYMYGNLPGLTMQSGNTIKWHLFGMGSEVDIHSAYFHGQTLTEQRHRVDTINLFPATLVETVMKPTTPGKWLLSCQVNDHVEAGMQAIYEVRPCTINCIKHNSNKQNHVRHYYIAAEEIIWNYGPSGINQFTGRPLDEPESESVVFFEKNEKRIGGSYKKAAYIEYTDATFTTQKERSPEQMHLGILGPIISAEVGDEVMVTFKNNASHPFSIQAHGVSYSKNNEGALYNTDVNPKGSHSTPASHVNPGETFTYVWSIPDDVGPTLEDPDCLTWLYYSGVDSIKDTSAGLAGPLIVCRKGTSKVTRAKDFVMIATVFDENLSWYLDDSIQMFAPSVNDTVKEDEDFQESNKMHSINGYMYGNQPGLDMCKGDTISWHMIGMGTEIDMHGISFSGNTFSTKGTNRNTANLFPHTSFTVTMVPDNEGVFDVECLTTDHLMAGMKQRYRVKNCHWSLPEGIYFHSKTFYIAAEEIEWDYAPSREWEKERHQYDLHSPASIFLDKGDKFIGTRYKKAVFREYTDKNFNIRKERTEEEEHLNILGPLLRANVGEKIIIFFKNKASRPYSIHAQGVRTDSSTVEETLPGETKKYIWKIPERAGPGKGDGDCITWPYFSTVDQVKDAYSGLVGPLIVCRKQLSSRFAVYRKIRFVLLFFIFNENESWYLQENIQTYSEHPDQVDVEDADFQESNKKHGINGRLYGNVQGLNMHVGDNVCWHLIGLGNEVDLHTVHFHGHSFEYQNTGVYHSDVYNLFPGSYQTLEMRPLYPGTWLLHCHVNDHIIAGMETTYTVLEKEEKPSLFRRIITRLSN
ncbi:ceruloplasmin [Ambystoma mexicanum]|uniref:ceruloplasmin n=1 Tax=Ambystoma mexicanum TaxID=8296 RepID=UPI0037E95CEA